MLLFSDAKVTVRGPGDVRVEGRIARHAPRIGEFFDRLGIAPLKVTLRGERWRVSPPQDPRVEQRIRNFLVNDCPVRTD
jgi:hypothetical protein